MQSRILDALSGIDLTQVIPKFISLVDDYIVDAGSSILIEKIVGYLVAVVMLVSYYKIVEFFNNKLRSGF